MTTSEGRSDREPDRHTQNTLPNPTPPPASEQAVMEAHGQAGCDEGPKPPSWRFLLTGLAIALVMATIMVTTYVSSEHAVVAHNLPWGVTGPSSLTTAVQQNISLKIHHFTNQSALENAATNTKIYGGFVPQTNTVIISEAASL